VTNFLGWGVVPDEDAHNEKVISMTCEVCYRLDVTPRV
jgi:hypothetical protein